MTIKFYLSGFLLFSSLSLTAEAHLRCASIALEPTAGEIEFQSLVDENLFSIEKKSSLLQKTKEDIQLENERRLQLLDELPQRRSEWKDLNARTAAGLIGAIGKNQVAGNQFRYERTDTEIGYCFGRATFVHLNALSLGFKKDQIKKIWAVGPMKTGSTQWRYHVGTMIRAKDGTWFVIDNFFGTPLTAKQWSERMKRFSTNEKLHIFITNPEKFGPLPGKYNRRDLGLDLNKKEDFYKGYFQDLMKTLEKKEGPPPVTTP